MARVAFEGVTKVFDDVVVVNALDLTVADNEFVVLVGPSGCGKSTTLRMVAGLEETTRGTIRIGERVVNDLRPRDRNIAMVFQNYALYPHMTVAENMSFGLTLARVPRDEIDRRVGKAARVLGIDGLLARRPAQLSGGERQRVAMGRALVRKPDVFLFDEPLSNLDAKLRTTMRTEIKRLHQRLRSTMIYVTHDQVEAMTLADRIAVMRAGTIEQVGTPGEVFERPANHFVAGFIGSPPMNFVDAVAADGRLRLADGMEIVLPAGRFRPPRAGQRVRLGIRAEDVVPEGLAPTPAERWQFESVVSLCEPLGSETLLITDLAGQELVARTFRAGADMARRRITFDLNLDRVHLFDAQTGRSLRAGAD